ncbi:GlxA family transcriptional regulator [Pseudomonas sp. MWU16-30317]|uniref:GlxA family transcriptional regulator n=1 Tax=Pseudomonas sp. MWU16-30317 TaxID=2878095 RepID=UPI001CFA04FD|nr:GlxA family transcriptional regulator [Pseudomonas sp. MWU16-30317]
MTTTPPAPSPRRIHILVIDKVFATTAMQAKDLFHLADLRHGRLPESPSALPSPPSIPRLETRLVSPDGLPACTFSGVVLPVDGGLEDADVIILPAFGGDFATLQARYPQILPWLRAQHARGATLCAEASGVYWLAEAGLLNGKEATTYWRFFDDFAERYPLVTLNRDKHLTDSDSLYCAAGSTSSCDLYVYLIERFCSVAVAQAVSREILFEVQRNYSPGRLGFGGQKLHHDPTILGIQQWLEVHFAEKFRFEDVAREHGMSIRNFMRRFHTATGDKPLHYLQRLRIETAKGLLSATRESIKTISYEVGYDDASFFARLFRHHTQLSPNQYRQQFMQES